MNAINKFFKNSNLWILLAVVAASFNLLSLILWHFNRSFNINFYFLLILPLVYLLKLDLKKTLIVIFIILLFGIALISEPIVDWDARSIWFFHAKKIFFTQGYSEQLSNYAEFSHNDYPPLIPAIAANLAVTFNMWDESLIKLSILLAVLPVIFLFATIFNNQYYCLLFLSMPLIANRLLYNGYMDVIVGFYLSSILIYLYYINNKKENNYNSIHEMFLLLLLSISLSLIKNEGFMSLVLLCITFCFNFKVITFKNLVILFVAIGFNYILWRYHLSVSNLHSDIFVEDIYSRFIGRITDFPQLFEIIQSPAKELGLFLIVYLLIFKNSEQNPFHAAPITFVISYVFIIFLIYFITPYDLYWHVSRSSGRVFVPIKILLMTILVYMSMQIHDKRKTEFLH